MEDNTIEVMSEAQRAQFIIDWCCRGSAVEFARAIGIDKSRMSKIVHGQLRLNRLYEAILVAYPDINPQWLRTGVGYPGDLSVDLVKKKYEKIIEEKDALIRTLQRVIEEKL